jgi:hypothetical protein
MLLPLQFNDGNPAPDALIVETLLDLERQFGSVLSDTQVIRGLWHHQGQLYRDELVRVFVDVADTAENREFFETFKTTLKERFNQIDIWMTTFPVEVV